MALKENVEILNANQNEYQQFLENVAVLERTLAEYQKIGTVDELREMKKNYKKFKQNKNKFYRDMQKRLKEKYKKGREEALEEFVQHLEIHISMGNHPEEINMCDIDTVIRGLEKRLTEEIENAKEAKVYQPQKYPK